MQSINAGFQNLRKLLPLHEGEKLSKAFILQQIAKHISQLKQEESLLRGKKLNTEKTVHPGPTKF